MIDCVKRVDFSGKFSTTALVKVELHGGPADSRKGEFDVAISVGGINCIDTYFIKLCRSFKTTFRNGGFVKRGGGITILPDGGFSEVDFRSQNDLLSSVAKCGVEAGPSIEVQFQISHV